MESKIRIDQIIDQITNVNGLTNSSCITLFFPQNQWCL